MLDVKQMIYDAAIEGFHDEVVKSSRWLIEAPRCAFYCSDPKAFVDALIKYNEYYENYEICRGLANTMLFVDEELKIEEITKNVKKNLELSDIYRQDEHE